MKMDAALTLVATAGLLLGVLMFLLEMNTHREILELGVFGRVPVDTLFELHIETRRGDVLTIYQTRCQASIGGWVCKTVCRLSARHTHVLH